jgi:hypothetical protein
MRRLLLISLLVALFVFPSFSSAQSNLRLSTVTVELWPEYDQPSMLVIVGFRVAPGVSLPVNLTFRIPRDANLIAVAVQSAEGNLLNADFSGVRSDGEWQSFTMPIDQNSVYRFEYYQPLTISGDQRMFSYAWDGSYAVDSFSVNVLEPLNVTSLVTIPPYASVAPSSGLQKYIGDAVALSYGEQYVLNLQYEKTSGALVVQSQTEGLQPSAPLNENTPGRVSFDTYLPYLLGGLGVILIVGGVFYYLQAGRTSPRRARQRKSPQTETGSVSESGSYCPQCGARARQGDRFCRTCGARLRK